MTIKAALLDAQGVYLRMDELPDTDALTQLHLPQISSCDLPAGQYRWVLSSDRKTFPQGGTFVPLRLIEERESNDAAVLALIKRKRQFLDEEEARVKGNAR